MLYSARIASPTIPMLEPIFLDELFDQQPHSTHPGGNDVWGLPLIWTYLTSLPEFSFTTDFA